MDKDAFFPITSVQNYITGKMALNIPSESGSGDWHFIQFFQGSGESPPSPYTTIENYLVDTNSVYGSYGVYECSDVLKKYGAKNCRDIVYAANHIRAYVDMVLNAACRGYDYHRSFEFEQWFNDIEAAEIYRNLLLSEPLLKPEQYKVLIEWFKGR